MGDDRRRGTWWPLVIEGATPGGAQRAFSLPTGTVTFLLSDVEGSTRRWEVAPDVMAIAIPRHYELLDEVIQRHGGVRPVEQGAGDSVVGAFSRASDAVAAAIDAQLALAAEPWPEDALLKVRIGVHSGEAHLRDEGNYVGQTLNRCARIQAAGHGGQILVSASTAALVADRLPAGTHLLDLGHHRLKDLGRPEQIWQVAHPDLDEHFPPLRSLDRFRHNLPVQLTPFIGRSTEVDQIGRSLAGDRIVTLTGSGGVGKSRLALAVAAEALEHCGGGVWWVELATITDGDGIGGAAVQALGGRDSPEVPVVEQLARLLGDQTSILVLDNCEHLVDATARLVTDLVSIAPSVSVLATSREPLGVPGEITFRVPSLGCPSPERELDIPALSQYEAVALFVERAHRARPSFVVTEANAAAIAQICHRLDGIPLALELAAARCRQLSPERIASELDDRFRLLTGGARTVIARQQTLLASVEWSHARLDDDEQIAFRRLAVFTGPFPLEAAEGVVAGLDTGPGAIDAVEVFDLMSRLVDKSLVTVDDGVAGELRYRMLETLRAHARDRAMAAGELEALRDAHARWWADWASTRDDLPTDEVIAAFGEFHDDLRAALDWSVGDRELGLRLLVAGARVWASAGRARDVVAAAERLLDQDPAEHLVELWSEAARRSSALIGLARSKRDELGLLDRIAEVAREHGDEFSAAFANYCREGDGALSLRDLADERGDRYLAIDAAGTAAWCLAEDDPASAAHALDGLDAAIIGRVPDFRDTVALVRAAVANAQGDLAAAVSHGRAIDGISMLDSRCREVSFAALLMDDPELLRAELVAAERGQRKVPGVVPVIDRARHRLALLDGAPSDVSPELSARRVDWGLTTSTLWTLARETIDAGEPQIALDGVRALAEPTPSQQAVVALVAGAATGDEDAWHRALRFALDRGARAFAVDALEGLACAAARSESWQESLRLLAAAERLRRETRYRWRFECEQRAVDDARAAAVAALDRDGADAIVEGAALDWREAGAYAQRARGERKRPSHGWASLTPTEEQVVALVAEGLTNSAIADRLFIGTATVKTHLVHVFAKLGVRTRAELAAAAARRERGPAGPAR